MFNRILRAIRLDRTLFRQVADNPEYTNEAVLVAILVAALSALGVAATASNPLLTFVVQLANSLLLGWVLWALIAYFVGAKVFKGRSAPMEMMRVLAYANTPRLLGVFSFIPCLGWILALAGWIIGIIAGVVAIRESMEFDTVKALVTSVLGLLLFIIANIIINMTIGAMNLPFAP